MYVMLCERFRHTILTLIALLLQAAHIHAGGNCLGNSVSLGFCSEWTFFMEICLGGFPRGSLGICFGELSGGVWGNCPQWVCRSPCTITSLYMCSSYDSCYDGYD